MLPNKVSFLQEICETKSVLGKTKNLFPMLLRYLLFFKTLHKYCYKNVVKLLKAFICEQLHKFARKML